ncbi:MAG: hypothetical protein N3B13_01670, partial [Deltaproteobacteria bacterium]|nr:hypothetical protein [Deltaproteobacteria bacterium]
MLEKVKKVFLEYFSIFLIWIKRLFNVKLILNSGKPMDKDHLIGRGNNQTDKREIITGLDKSEGNIIVSNEIVSRKETYNKEDKSIVHYENETEEVVSENKPAEIIQEREKFESEGIEIKNEGANKVDQTEKTQTDILFNEEIPTSEEQSVKILVNNKDASDGQYYTNKKDITSSTDILQHKEASDLKAGEIKEIDSKKDSLLSDDKMKGIGYLKTSDKLESENKLSYEPNGKFKGKQEKPNIKKAPTEENKNRKDVKSDNKEREESKNNARRINLGENKRRESFSSIHSCRQTGQRSSVTNETTESSNSEEESIRVFSPFVEFNIREGKVSLVIPSQKLSGLNLQTTEQSCSFCLKVNDDNPKEIKVEVSNNSGGTIITKEEKIILNNPLKKFSISYPRELFGERIYEYEHKCDFVYIFVAKDDEYGIMHYLYDSEGNYNPLPARCIWIFLKNKCKLSSPSPIIMDERRFWENYNPQFIELQENGSLNFSKDDGQLVEIPCVKPFKINGSSLIEDDYKKSMPLFNEGEIKLIAPEGIGTNNLVVYIQNRMIDKYVKKDWESSSPLSIRLNNEDLPTEFGEYQIDICKDMNSIDTLFFRYIPGINLEYTKETIIVSCPIENLDLMADVEEICRNEEKYSVPKDSDVVTFSIEKRGKPETKTKIKITIPRLRWRLSTDNIWQDKHITISKED